VTRSEDVGTVDFELYMESYESSGIVRIRYEYEWNLTQHQYAR
jgi:hypothetical protein